MIKVINTVPNPSVVKRIVCKHCGSELEYVPNDVQKRIERDYTGCAEEVRFIKCPICVNELYVNR